MCALPFLQRSFAIVHCPASRSTSRKRIPATSSRRWPVRSSTLNTEENGQPSSVAACQNALISSSVKTRSRFRLREPSCARLGSSRSTRDQEPKQRSGECPRRGDARTLESGLYLVEDRRNLHPRYGRHRFRRNRLCVGGRQAGLFLRPIPRFFAVDGQEPFTAPLNVRPVSFAFSSFLTCATST